MKFVFQGVITGNVVTDISFVSNMRQIVSLIDNNKTPLSIHMSQKALIILFIVV